MQIVTDILRFFGLISEPKKISEIKNQLKDLSLENLVMICEYLESVAICRLSCTSKYFRNTLSPRLYKNVDFKRLNKGMAAFWLTYVTDRKAIRNFQLYTSALCLYAAYDPTRLQTFQKFTNALLKIEFTNIQRLHFSQFTSELLNDIGGLLVQMKTLKDLSFSIVTFTNLAIKYDKFFDGVRTLRFLNNFEFYYLVPHQQKNADPIVKAGVPFSTKLLVALGRNKKLSELKVNRLCEYVVHRFVQFVNKVELQKVDLGFSGDQSHCEQSFTTITNRLAAEKQIMDVTFRFPPNFNVTPSIVMRSFHVFSRSKATYRKLHLECKSPIFWHFIEASYDRVPNGKPSELSFSMPILFKDSDSYARFCRIFLRVNTLLKLSTLKLTTGQNAAMFKFSEHKVIKSLNLDVRELSSLQSRDVADHIAKNKTLNSLTLLINDDTNMEYLSKGIRMNPTLRTVRIEMTCLGKACNCNVKYETMRDLVRFILFSQSWMQTIYLNFNMASNEWFRDRMTKFLNEKKIRFEWKADALRIFRPRRNDLRIIWSYAPGFF